VLGVPALSQPPKALACATIRVVHEARYGGAGHRVKV
jgi:hypothetical protein